MKKLLRRIILVLIIFGLGFAASIAYHNRSYFSQVTDNIAQITAPACNNINDNVGLIFKRLLDETDLTKEQVAGVVGNLQSESAGSFSPFVHEYTQAFDDGGWGIAQWTGYRRDNDNSSEYVGVVAYSRDKIGADTFDQYYKDYGRIGKDCTPDGVPDEINEQFLNTQVDFLVRELTYRILGFNTTYSKLKDSTTIDAASDTWLIYFEGPADVESVKQQRRNYAHEIYDKYH